MGNSKKIIIGILIGLVILLYIWLCSKQTVWPPGSEKVKPGLETCSTEYLKEMMEYHGILIIQRDLETGEWFFYREEKKCWIK